jgi:HD-GYP domain-containing protein (c-di-GMP phosphodiesterase class II)
MTMFTNTTSKNDEIVRAALEQIPDGITIVNADDRVIFANKMASEARNIDAASQLEYLKGEEKKAFRRIIFDQVRERYYEDTCKRIFDKSNNYMGSVVVSKDITNTTKCEEERATNLQHIERKIEALTGDLQLLLVSTMSSLVAALEAKDRYTKGHSLRVCDMAVKMAEHKWGMCKESRDVELAGKLHDIGKIGISETILNKPGGLTDEEFHHIKDHPIIGQNILLSIENLKSIAKMIRHHHEKFDGSGYPDHLNGDLIPEGSKIMAIADSYDAMTSERPYRPPMDPQKAAQEIEKNAGTQFDPQWTKIFLELFYSGNITETLSVESMDTATPVPNLFAFNAACSTNTNPMVATAC